MVPDYWVTLDRLPTTANDKVSVTALPEPTWASTDRERGADPVGDTERHLAEIWCDVLRRTDVGRDDDFFELGGHSLTGTRLAAEIDTRFRVRMPLRMLFELRTIVNLATWLDGALLGRAPNAPSVGADAHGSNVVGG
jgi:acyl carrier protein